LLDLKLTTTDQDTVPLVGKAMTLILCLFDFLQGNFLQGNLLLTKGLPRSESPKVLRTLLPRECFLMHPIHSAGFLPIIASRWILAHL
jgi:hypothetical protein